MRAVVEDLAMAFVLRFVQRFRPEHREAFMELEAGFADLERRRPDFPKGRRMQPYAGREPTNSMIWECEFATLAEVQEALAFMEADAEHKELFDAQVPYFAEAYTEIYEVLDF
jgi:hypothetical protein